MNMLLFYVMLKTFAKMNVKVFGSISEHIVYFQLLIHVTNIF